MVRTKEQPLKIEHVPVGDLRPDPFNPRLSSGAELEAAGSPLGASLPNTTRELCFMGRSRPGPAEDIGGRGARNLEDWGRRPMGAAACVRCQIRPGGYAG